MTSAQTTPTSETAELAAGAWLHNPVTGELVRIDIGPAETAGRRIEADLWLQPGAALAGAHVHEHLVERFEPMAGAVSFQVAGVEREARAGEGAIEGMPDPLWLAASAHEYRDVIRFTRPPAFVQAALFGPLAALARRTGRDPLARELHGPTAASAIPAPTDDRLRELLARPVGARAGQLRARAARADRSRQCARRRRVIRCDPSCSCVGEPRGPPSSSRRRDG